MPVKIRHPQLVVGLRTVRIEFECTVEFLSRLLDIPFHLESAA